MPINIPVLSTLASLAAGAQNLSVIDAIFTAIRSALTGIAIQATDVLAGTGISVTIAGGQPTIASTQSLFRQANTPAAIANTLVESNLFSTTIAANTIGTNKLVRLTAFGELLNNRGGNTVYTFRVYLGTTVVMSFVATAPTSANIAAWQVLVDIAGGNATNAQKARGTGFMTDATAGAANAGIARVSVAGGDKRTVHDSVAEDSTTALTYKLTVQMDTADPASTCTITNAQAELI